MSIMNFGSGRILRAGGFLFNTYPQLGIRVINETGSSIAADKVVAVVGVLGTLDPTAGIPNIVLADADVASHDDLYVTVNAIANGATGYVYKGALSAANLNTNNVAAAGDPVYLSETAGAFAATAPITGGTRVIPVGYATVKSATVGRIAWNTLNGYRQGKLKLTLVAGQDETGDTTIPVSGMVVGDEVHSVTVFTTAASIASRAARAITDFTVTAGNLTVVANAANNTNNQYEIIWSDKT